MNRLRLGKDNRRRTGHGLKNRHSITLTAWDRPALFRRTLASVLANDLTGWRFVIRIEPGDRAAQIVEVARQMLGDRDYSLVVNDRRLGIRENPFRTIDQAFAEGAVLNLALEEDMLVARDVTAMALWFAEHHRPSWLCLSLLAGPCGSTAFISDPRYPDLLFESRTFNSHGFAVRRQEWERHMRAAWMGVANFRPDKGFGAWRHHWGWDWSIYGLVATDPDLRSVQPVLARATHTGREGGTYAKEAFHDRAFDALCLHGGGPVPYRMVAVEDLPREVRSQVYAHAEMTEMRLMLERFATARASWRRLFAGEPSPDDII